MKHIAKQLLTDIEEWRRSVVQCTHLDARWIKVKIKIKIFYSSHKW